jgi:DNA-binding transcriptional MerR regulator
MLIGELSRTCNCPVETIRYYERIGLLPPASRRPNRYRCYDETHVNLLRFIVRAKQLGLTQNETRQLTQLAQRKNPACSDVFAILDKQHREVRERIARLRRMERTLLQLKDQCCNGTRSECPVLEVLMQ